MIRKTSYSNALVHFNRWSRKSYAVFASLGMVVAIGQLTTASVQWILDITMQVGLDAEIVLRILNNDDSENVGVYDSIDSIAYVVANSDDYTLVNKQLLYNCR